MKRKMLHVGISLAIASGISICASTMVWAEPPQEPAGGSPAENERYHPNRVLVKLTLAAATKDNEALARKFGADSARGFIKAKGKLEQWRVLTLPNDKAVEAVVKALSHNPNVERAQPDYVIRLNQTPDDARYDELWGMHNTGQTGGIADADIDAPEAWESHVGSRDIVVAVIDTGVDYTHPDLADNIWINEDEISNNGVDDDGNGYVDDVYGVNFIWNSSSDAPMDDHGHGTHVAGTIAAMGNNQQGVAGVNWNSRIMPLKFLSSSGGGYASDAAAAIDYARGNGAKIMSNSWGGGWDDYMIADAVSDANDAGILFVAAAGNSAVDVDSGGGRIYPAGYTYPNIISVAATDQNDGLAWFSNWGATSVDIGAPGVNILSTVPSGSCTLCDPSGYLAINGTSMATPHVSGAAALLWGRFPGLTMAEVKQRLLDSGDSIAALAGLTVSGKRLNVNQAVAMVDYGATLGPVTQSVQHGNGASYTFTVTSNGLTQDNLQLAVSTMAPGLSGSLADSSLILPAGGTASTSLNVSTTAGMARGIYPVQIDLIDNAGVASTIESAIKVLVPSASVTAPGTARVIGAGGSAEINLTLTSVDGYSGPVQLSASSADVGLSFAFNPTSLNLAPGGTATVAMTVQVDAATVLQVHDITVTATSGSTNQQAVAKADVRQINVCPSGCTYSAIQAAIDASPAGTWLLVGDGTYYETLNINKAITLLSASGPANTIITPPAGVQARVITTSDPSLNLNGFTVTGGYSSDGVGGAVYSSANRAYVSNCIITGNTGGVYIGQGFIYDSVISNNTGVGVAVGKYGRASGNVFEGNSYGLRIPGYNFKTYSNNVFRNNYMGVYVWGSYGNPIIANSIFDGNAIGVYVIYYAKARVVNSLFVNHTNKAMAWSSYSNVKEVRNSIFWNNAMDFDTVWGGPDVKYSLLSSPRSGTGNIVGDPMFVGNGDYRLLPGSPAIDSGMNTAGYGVTTDIDDFSRPLDGDGLGSGTTGDGSDYDMGPYEHSQYLTIN